MMGNGHVNDCSYQAHNYLADLTLFLFFALMIVYLSFCTLFTETKASFFPFAMIKSIKKAKVTAPTIFVGFFCDCASSTVEPCNLEIMDGS